MYDYLLALDLGKSSDPTGIVILQREPTDVEEEYRCSIVSAEELPLGTPFLEVVRHVEGLFSSDELAGKTSVVIDGTGVGAPVVELFQENASLKDFLYSVVFTSGKNQRQDGSTFYVPKTSLISSVLVMGQQGLLTCEWTSIPGGMKLKRQLSQFVGKKQGASMSYEGSGSSHDDLVCALAVGCWLACNVPQDPGMLAGGSYMGHAPSQLIAGRHSIGIDHGFSRPPR